MRTYFSQRLVVLGRDFLFLGPLAYVNQLNYPALTYIRPGGTFRDQRSLINVYFLHVE